MRQTELQAVARTLGPDEYERLVDYARRLARRVAAREMPVLMAKVKTREAARADVAEGWCDSAVGNVHLHLQHYAGKIVARRAREGISDDPSLAAEAAGAGTHIFWGAYDDELLRLIDDLPAPPPKRHFGSLGEVLRERRQRPPNDPRR